MTCCEFPDISPFTHRLCRLREKYVARRVVMVARKASSFIHASIRTCREVESWAMAGTRPAESNRTRARTSSGDRARRSAASLPIRDIVPTDRQPCVIECRLHVGDREMAEVKNAGRQHSIGSRLHRTREIVDDPCPTARN